MDADFLDCWRRLIADPVTGGGAFAAAALPRLEADLARLYPRVDEHLRCEAADSAVLAVIQRPDAYDPARLGLPAYLRMVAGGDLKNLLDKEKRRSRGRIPWAGVELGVPARNEREEEAFAEHPELAAVVAGFTPEEAAVFELMCDGERATELFAAALGLPDAPEAERFAAVQRVKDRIKARLKRAGGKS